jgi:CRP/FNR family transcriptional regulator/CRP/FNR family cyclic AMP-dependent transcriptional regulator
MADMKHSVVLPSLSVRMTMHLQSSPLFEGLQTDELFPLADILTETRFARGSQIFEQGTEGQHMYLVLEGALEASRNGELVRTYKRGDTFGELSMLDGGVRVVTVRSTEDSILAAIAHDDFHDLLSLYPTLARGVIDMLSNRLRDVVQVEE